MSNDKEVPNNATVSLAEETAEINVRKHVTGTSRISTRTEFSDEEIEAEIESSEVAVTRIAVGRDLDLGEPVPTTRDDGDTTIIPVLEEYLFVEKRMRLVEEVHIRRTTKVEHVNVPVTLRRQVANIEHNDVPTDSSNPNIK